MYISFLKSTMHRAKFSECDLHYEGFNTFDFNYTEIDIDGVAVRTALHILKPRH